MKKQTHQFMDSSREKEARTFLVEEFRTVLAGKRDGLGYLTNEFDDLSDMIVVLAVPRSRSRIE
jgi:hypothetical protein